MKIPVGLLLFITATCFSALHDTAAASGVCSMSGGGHYYTFDGTKFDYQGLCKLNFSTDCSGSSNFSIKFDYENRFSNQNVSFLSYITVDFGTVVTIGHYPNPDDPVTVRIDGTQAVLPINDTDYSITNVTEACDLDILLNVSLYNFTIRYNEWGVTLIVDDSYKSNLCGICGNFNGNSTDDLIDDSFDANSYYPNSGRAWGDHWVVDQNCLTTSPTHDDVPGCTSSSYTCSTACDYLADSSGIYSSAVQAMGATLAQDYQQDCEIDACVTDGASYRSSVRQFINYARLKYPSCTGCHTTIGGFPVSYGRVWCNDARCDCSSTMCQLHIPLCSYWCDCVGLTGGYGTLYQCWDGPINNRCYLLTDSMADVCTVDSGTAGSSVSTDLPTTTQGPTTTQ